MNRLRSPRVVLTAVLCVAAAVAWVTLRTGSAQAQAPATPAASPNAPAGAADGPAGGGKGRKGGGAADAIPVIVAPVTEASDGVALELLGTGSARKSVTVYAPVAGEVAQVLFKPGKPVRAGDALVRLVDRHERLAVELAQAKVNAARVMDNRYEATRGTGAVPDTVSDEARASLRSAEIELAQAREALSDRVVRAPFAGTPGLAAVEVGERIASDTVLTTLDDRGALHIDVQIPEAYLTRVSVGQPVRALNPAHPGQRFEGQVIEIDSRVDPVTRQIKVRAALPNKDDRLRSGMSFQLQLELKGHARAGPAMGPRRVVCVGGAPGQGLAGAGPGGTAPEQPRAGRGRLEHCGCGGGRGGATHARRPRGQGGGLGCRLSRPPSP